MQNHSKRVKKMKYRLILDESQISRSLTRMSHEILERNKGTENIVLLGIKTRGEFLALRLQEKIRQIEGVDVPAGTIDISNYRDDKPQDMEIMDAVKY
jgi:pyrimidine operon attenuation protein/uracil phosphoribosyltransferase